MPVRNEWGQLEETRALDMIRFTPTGDAFLLLDL